MTLSPVTLNGEPFSTVYTAADAQTQDPATLLTTTPEGRQTLSTLDEQGRVVRTEVPGVHPIVWEYDSQGRLSSATHGPDDPNDPDYAERRVTSFNYKTTTDNQNRLLDMLTDAENRVTSFGYDDAGRVTQQTRPDSEQIGYGYDDNGNLDSLTPPGRPAHEFDYTAVNLESFYIPPQPSPTIPEPRTKFVYDKDRQLEEIRWPDGQVIDFVYGETDGRLQSVAAGTDVRTYTHYDLMETNPGQLKTLTGPGADLSFTYDGALLRNETWTIGSSSHTVAQTYDNDLEVGSIAVDNEAPVGFNRDGDGLLRFAGNYEFIRDPDTGQLTGTLIDNIRDTYEYNGFGEVEHYRVTSYADPNNSAGTVLFAIDYERDRLGRIVQKTESIEGTTRLYDYTYDPAGRLWIVKEGPDEFSLQETARYSYDDNGNRKTKVTPSESCTYNHDDQDRLLSTVCGSTTMNYTYTHNGEIASKDENNNVTNYVHDAMGNLTAVSLHTQDPNDTIEIEYLFDGRDRRVGKKVDGLLVQILVYKDSLNPVAEFNGTGGLVAQFVYAAKANVPDYIVKHGSDAGVYRLVSDHLGGTRLVVNTLDATVAQRIDHDEFGLVRQDTAPGFQPFGFAGGLYDPSTEFLHFGARDYDPRNGRWTSKDPIRFDGGDTNLYGYVLNDPVNLIDPEGKAPWHWPRCWSLAHEWAAAVDRCAAQCPDDAQGQVEFMGKYGSTNIQDAIGECARQSDGGKEYVENCSKAVLGPLNPFFKLWWRTR